MLTFDHDDISTQSSFQPPKSRLQSNKDELAAISTLTDALPNSPSPSPNKSGALGLSFGGMGSNKQLKQINQRLNGDTAISFSSPGSMTRNDDLSISLTREDDMEIGSSRTRSHATPTRVKLRSGFTPKKQAQFPKENFVNSYVPDT